MGGKHNIPMKLKKCIAKDKSRFNAIYKSIIGSITKVMKTPLCLLNINNILERLLKSKKIINKLIDNENKVI